MLQSGKNILFDNCNVSYNDRRHQIKLAREYKGYVVYCESEWENEVQNAPPFKQDMEKLYELKILGKNEGFEEAFKNLVYNSIGRIL